MEAKLMKVFMGCDHAGYELKEILKQHLIASKKYDIEDLGAYDGKTSVRTNLKQETNRWIIQTIQKP